MAIRFDSGGTVNTSTYRPDIDGLRAIAVLLVVFFHAGLASASGGFVGVDIFFVISGYLITGIIAKELEEGQFTFANFYGRRIRRICPALFVTLGFSVIAGLFILIPSDLKMFGRSVVSTVLFYSNFLFYHHVNYFSGPAIEKPLLHTWSLAIEEQYYLIWPVAMLALYRTSGRKYLPHVILALLGASLAASQIALDIDASQSFYLLPYRGWELLLGAYLAVAPSAVIPKRAANLTGFAGFALIAYAAIAFDAKTPFPGINAIFPCLGAAMVIAAGAHRQVLARAILSFSPLRFLGKISYSLYLIHWPIFSFANLALNRELLLGERLTIVAVSILLAALSYRYVETPARRTSFRFPALAKAAAAAAVPLAVCGALYDVADGLPWRAPEGVQIASAARYPGAGVQDRADCRADPKPAHVHHPCPIGAAAQDMQYDFVIWGDSHARHFASGFSDQAKARGLSGLVIWEAHCPPLLNETRVSAKCREANAQVERWLASQVKLKAVFLAANWNEEARAGLLGAPKEGSTGSAGAEAAPGEPAGGPGLENTANLLRSRNLPFAIVETVPFVSVDVPSCAARSRMFGQPEGRCFSFPRHGIEQYGQQASLALAAASRRFGVPIVSTLKAFCDEDTCRAEKDGVILYMDANHLNSAGSHYLGSRLVIPWPAKEAQRDDGATLKVSAGGR